MFLTRKQLIISGVAGLLVFGIIAVGLGTYYGVHITKLDQKLTEYVGGVVTNGHECAAIGSEILQKNGTAVDAAIAALFCEGVAMPQSMGLGGGFVMTVYIRKNKTVDTLNAREAAPLRATENMFDGNASLSAKGGLSVAVPGELRGYWYAHKKYGVLPWVDLVQPTIDLCKKGHVVTAYLEKLFKNQEAQIRQDPGLREIYINPKTNDTYKEGDLVKRYKLAETLEVVARDGADALYDGKLTNAFIKDIKNAGGIIEADDMKKYEPKWEKPVLAHLPDNQTLYTVPLPGSGVILTFILHILSGFLDHSNIQLVTNWQRIVESFKYGYGKRTELGDPDFVSGIQPLLANLTSPAYAKMIRERITDTKTFQDPEHYGANVTQVENHGTAHISVLAPNGDAVSVTSTINMYFGAGIRSLSTGIILNDEMDDFSSPNITNGFDLPPSPANYIRPEKRPLSSMCPSIVIDKNGDATLVIGAAGGSKITTTTALVTLKHLWFGQSLLTAVPSSRLHHQLFPMEIHFEHDFNKKLIKELEDIGHKGKILGANDGFAALTAISKRNGVVEGSVDHRRSGQVVLIR